MSFFKKLFGNKEREIQTFLEQGAIVIDVRTPEEFKMGHAKNAVNIPLQEISSQMEKIRQFNKPIITCCKSGARSLSATNIIRNQGIEVMNGGSWQKVDQYLK